MKSHRRFRRYLAIAVATCTVAAPVASAAPAVDVPTHNSSAAGQLAHPRQDLRSPDTRDASPKSPYEPAQVLGSRGVGSPRPVVGVNSAPKVKSTDGGLDMPSIAIGAGGFAAIVVMFALGSALTDRRARVHAVR